MSKKSVLLLSFLAAVFFLCGCSGGSIEQYYALPQPTEEYLQLQELIDARLADGREYTAPTGGSWHQAVQLYDLNMDGTDEALAFFRGPDRELEVCVYVNEKHDGYREALCLSSEGSSFAQADYRDLDNDGFCEMLITRQLSANIRILTVYDLNNWNGSVLLTADCRQYLTIKTDSGTEDLLVLRSSGSGSWLTDLYSFADGISLSTASLSAGIETVTRLEPVFLRGGSQAVIAESSCTNGEIVTDLLTRRDGRITNISAGADGNSGTRRAYNTVYAQDVDGDGCIDIPRPIRIFSGNEGVTRWSILWTSYAPDGTALTVGRTYHCTDKGWYFKLPSGWETGLTAREENSSYAESCTILSRVGTTGSIHDLIAIYTLTGEDRESRSLVSGRIPVGETASALYAIRIFDGITEDEAVSCFRLINRG